MCVARERESKERERGESEKGREREADTQTEHRRGPTTRQEGKDTAPRRHTAKQHNSDTKTHHGRSTLPNINAHSPEHRLFFLEHTSHACFVSARFILASKRWGCLWLGPKNVAKYY